MEKYDTFFNNPKIILRKLLKLGKLVVGWVEMRQTCGGLLLADGGDMRQTCGRLHLAKNMYFLTTLKLY